MSLSLPFRSQTKLNFWDETQRLLIHPGFMIHTMIGNQRFANEVALDASKMTENHFRGLSGIHCRSALGNGYFEFEMRSGYMKITMWKKPFKASEISVLAIGEFIVIHAEHDFQSEYLEDFKEFSEPSKSTVASGAKETSEDSKEKECGIVSRSMTRRYMFPRGVNRNNVSYYTKESEDVLYICARWKAPTNAPNERTVPIVVQD